MQKTVLNVKVNPQTKEKAKEVAENMGFSLSALINAFLTQLIKTKSVQFHVDEVPTEFVKKILKQAQKNRKQGKASPVFDNADDAVQYLKQQGI
ncbi:MAG: hypothetical protein A2857_00055 [Candidatus Levybacteria bacterium RIFCSPHIGHO2_01_FULL_36_15]|nr:MAG: hypothetical protein A2857_00055 [Candidatus Levybacteria bacterium RIFCSPHIGHO2_01_FULL_36_15]OGH36939.1 MAG: hypothetical protein A2905_00975 [Candidatus Levybacteria bacterium RIFCSPLOWO2_01_FULL_36_10]